jgi:hypothetical protein
MTLKTREKKMIRKVIFLVIWGKKRGLEREFGRFSGVGESGFGRKSQENSGKKAKPIMNYELSSGRQPYLVIAKSIATKQSTLFN